jgi:hypothetical protein
LGRTLAAIALFATGLALIVLGGLLAFTGTIWQGVGIVFNGWFGGWMEDFSPITYLWGVPVGLAMIALSIWTTRSSGASDRAQETRR